MFSLTYRIEVEAQQWPWAAPRSLHSPPQPPQPAGRPTAQHRSQDKRRGQKNFFFSLFPPFPGSRSGLGLLHSNWSTGEGWGHDFKLSSGESCSTITKSPAQSHLPPLLLFLNSPRLLSSPVPSPFPLGFCHISLLGKGSNRRRSLPPPLPRGRPQEHWDQRHWGPSAQELAPHSAQRPAGWAVRAFGDSSRAWCHPGPIARSWGSVPPQEGAVGGFSVETATVGRTGEAVGKISHG